MGIKVIVGQAAGPLTWVKAVTLTLQQSLNTLLPHAQRVKQNFKKCQFHATLFMINKKYYYFYDIAATEQSSFCYTT